MYTLTVSTAYYMYTVLYCSKVTVHLHLNSLQCTLHHVTMVHTCTCSTF